MKTFRKISVFAIFLAAAVALSLPFTPPLKAQVTTGVLAGTVTDPTGAVVPQAEVKITNMGTNITTPTKTDTNGFYRVGELPVGQYKIGVSAKGFKTSVRSYLTLNAGAIERVDFALQLGEQQQVVTVEAGTPLVQTEQVALYQTVGNAQVANLPLNGRNVFDLMQISAGAVNVQGVDFENGHGTVINGLRPDFIGFLTNGVSNKGLSGGVVTVPNADLVQEFQELSLNMSAQYGNSAAGIVNVITKSGTNDFHGSLYEFDRNDKFDANSFFRNATKVTKPALRFNQFGATIEGPILKSHLFFTGSYQGERFTTAAPPTPIVSEAPEWSQFVQNSLSGSVAALLYGTKQFQPVNKGTPFLTLSQYVTGNTGGSSTGFPNFAAYMCPDNYPAGFTNLATRFQQLFGVLPNGTGPGQDDFSHSVPNAQGQFVLPCSVTPTPAPGLVTDRNIPFQNSNVLDFGTQTEGNLFNGNEGSGRIDWEGKNDRIFGEYYWQKATDSFGPSNASSGIHGFRNPTDSITPNFQFSYVHTFSPHLLNEFRAGYNENRSDILVSTPGVPSVSLDDGSAGFGSYAGYPQMFHENIYSYSDMVSITKGRHNLKTGVDFRRNIENSEFDIARPSYYFNDPLFFALAAPYKESAGVDPGFFTNAPSQLSDNVRHWRNLEVGAYFQDDWKVRRNFTLQLGLRYDLYTRHVEKSGLQTTFIPGPGGSIAGNGFFLDAIKNANVPAGTPGCDTPQAIHEVVLAGICGPGGFAAASSLGEGNHKNFSPRVGFAWDPFGKGKTSVRGGFGISYEGTLYNPLSNSRWNPPFYTFDEAFNGLGGGNSIIVYGPTNCVNANNPQNPFQFSCSPSGAAPTFTGAAPPGQHSGNGVQATGNINGWNPGNSNFANLTGIVFPSGIRDPRIYNYYFGIQHEILPNTALEVDYVGTQGVHLFRAENANRIPGGSLPEGTCVMAQGRQECSLVNSNPQEINGVAQPGTAINPSGFLNPNYGTLRVWDNVSKSWYNALQASLRHQFGRGVAFTANYAWSHSIDTGSTWHSGATTANGGAAGDGYSLDQTRPGLDRGNSIFDIRHRLVFDYVWELPWYKSQQGFLGHVLGGWQYNGLWSFQSGAHFSAFCSGGGPGGRCDFNKDGVANDRPNDPNGNFINETRQQWANGAFKTGTLPFGCPFLGCANPFFTKPCPGCNGDLGRNTFVGPGIFDTDESIFKNIKITERFKLQFRTEIFNAFNRANFILGSIATGGNGNNRITSSKFGQAGGTLDPREIQFGLKLLW